MRISSLQIWRDENRVILARLHIHQKLRNSSKDDNKDMVIRTSWYDISSARYIILLTRFPPLTLSIPFKKKKAICVYNIRVIPMLVCWRKYSSWQDWTSDLSYQALFSILYEAIVHEDEVTFWVWEVWYVSLFKLKGRQTLQVVDDSAMFDVVCVLHANFGVSALLNWLYPMHHD